MKELLSKKQKNVKEPELSVIFSFRNEKETLPALWERLLKTLEDSGIFNFEAIFVNDASSDGSKEFLIQLAKSEKRIVLVNLTRRFGVSEGVLAGFAISRGDLIVYMDSDLQDPPELIPEMIKMLKNNSVDVIHTKRVSRAGETRLKLLVTKLGYWYLNKFSNPPLDIEYGDFKLLTRRVVNSLMENAEAFPFLRGMIQNLGYPSEVLEYDRGGRYNGKAATKYRLFGKSWFTNHLNSTLISFSDFPLRVILYLGFSFVFIAFVFIPIVIYMKLQGVAVPGWTGIILSVIVFQSINLLFLGVLGLYIHSIFHSVKKRPIYIIESVFKKSVD